MPKSYESINATQGLGKRAGLFRKFGGVVAEGHKPRSKSFRASSGELRTSSNVGSTKHVRMLEGYIANGRSQRGVVTPGRPYVGSLRDIALAVAGDGETALTHVILAGESAYGVASNGTSAQVVLLPYGFLRAQPGRNDRAQRILANARISRPGGSKFRIGSNVQGLSEDVYLSPSHFDVTFGESGELQVTDNGSEFGTYVLDAVSLINDSELGRKGRDSAVRIYTDLQDSYLWNPSSVPRGQPNR